MKKTFLTLATLSFTLAMNAGANDRVIEHETWTSSFTGRCASKTANWCFKK